jgi:hypothetical protein
VPEAQVHERIAFGIGQQELLGVVREYANTVYLLIDHAVDYAPLSVEIQFARFGEWRGRNRKEP